MGSEGKSLSTWIKTEKNIWNSKQTDSPHSKWRKEHHMIKHQYQTCLRMPLSLKEDMTTICDRYHINESDFMRRAIVQFVETMQQNSQQNSRYMFLWGNTRISLGHYIQKDPDSSWVRVFFCFIKKVQKKVMLLCLKSDVYRSKMIWDT